MILTRSEILVWKFWNLRDLISTPMMMVLSAPRPLITVRAFVMLKITGRKMVLLFSFACVKKILRRDEKMKYATVADVIAALQKMPQDAPVFGYSETDECDSRIEVVELYTPSQDIIDDFNGQVAEGWDWPEVRPEGHYCQADSYITDYWREQKKVTPVVYIRESMWSDRENKNRKENVVCLTVDM
jgi:hypothetical protein